MWRRLLEKQATQFITKSIERTRKRNRPIQKWGKNRNVAQEQRGLRLKESSGRKNQLKSSYSRSARRAMKEMFVSEILVTCFRVLKFLYP